MNGSCANASNPYHQCTQACSQKTKGTKTHHAATAAVTASNSNSNNRKVINGGERRTYASSSSSCPKSSNPYHKCDANCNNSGSSPLSLSIILISNLFLQK